MRRAAVSVVALALGACASSPEKIQTTYVSPLQYQDYSCPQVAAELSRVTRRAGELQGSLKKDADADAWQVGVGLILLWPVLLALEGGDGPEAAEYSRLKGERDALEQVAIQKNCGIQVEEVVAPAP